MKSWKNAVPLRLTALLLALVLLVPCFDAALADGGEAPWADKPTGPNGKWSKDVVGEEIDQSTGPYTIDGVTYYDVASEHVDDPTQYYNDLISGNISVPGYTTQSIADYWLKVAMGCMGEVLIEDDDEGVIDEFYPYMKQAIERHGDVLGATGEWNGQNGAWHGVYGWTAYGPSVKSAFEQLVKKRAETGKYPGEDMYKLLSNYTKEEDVVAAFACAYHENPTSDTFSSVAAFFSDFQVVGLLPDGAESGEGKPKRYVSRKISEERSLDKTYASNVKNLTLQPITASQNLSNSWTSTVSSSVNRSESYSFSEGIKIGVEKEFAIAKVTAEFSFTATQAFTEGWSKGQSLSKSGVVADSVAVPLPPYTNVILEQGNSVTALETKYNCPVGLKYKVRLVGYNSTGAQTYDQSGAWTFETDARADLYKRAVRNGSYDSETGGDSEHMPVKWTVATTVPGVSDAIKAAAYHVPMTATGGKFTEHVETIFTDVKTIVPTHQLSTVKLAKPDVTVISGGDFSYDNLNYLHQDMDVGDSSFTGLLKVEGLNTYGADYYGFYQPQGHWKVLDEDGATELDPQTGPIQLADPTSANTKYTAMEPGTYYLKYCINDNTYPKFKLDGSPVEAGINPSAPDRANGDETEYLTDADINSRAMLEITVTEDETAPSHTVGVTGSYPKAEVGKYAPKLEDGGLVVSIKGDDGVEIEEDYTWQAQELPARGITVQADGTVSFSKAGTFHVRAVCQHGIASE